MITDPAEFSKSYASRFKSSSLENFAEPVWLLVRIERASSGLDFYSRDSVPIMSLVCDSGSASDFILRESVPVPTLARES